jgi:hypothetical protein
VPDLKSNPSETLKRAYEPNENNSAHLVWTLICGINQNEENGGNKLVVESAVMQNKRPIGARTAPNGGRQTAPLNLLGAQKLGLMMSSADFGRRRTRILSPSCFWAQPLLTSPPEQKHLRIGLNKLEDAQALFADLLNEQRMFGNILVMLKKHL